MTDDDRIKSLESINYKLIKDLNSAEEQLELSHGYIKERDDRIAELESYINEIDSLMTVILRIRNRHLEPRSHQEGERTLRMDLNDLDDFLDDYIDKTKTLTDLLPLNEDQVTHKAAQLKHDAESEENDSLFVRIIKRMMFIR